MTRSFDSIARLISGNPHVTPLEQRIFNIASFCIALSYVLSFIWSFLNNLPLLYHTLSLINVFVYGWVFLVARLKNKLLLALFFIHSLITFSIHWIYFGGIHGSAPIAYLILVIVLLIVSPRRYLIYIVLLIFANILLLYGLDIAEPIDERINDMAILGTLSTAIIILSVTLNFFVKNYKEEQAILRQEKIKVKQAESESNENLQKLLRSTENLQIANQKLDEQYSALEKSTLLCTIDLNGRFTFINKNACELIQKAQQELIGKSYSTVFHPDLSVFFIRDVLKTLRNKETWIGTIKVQAKDESPYWLKSTIMPIIDTTEHGTSHFMCICNNITNEIILQERERSQAVLYRTLEISMQDIPIKEMLKRCLENVFSASWLKIHRKGGFYLTAGSKSHLKMVSHENLHEYPRILDISNTQSTIALAACSRQIIFVNRSQEGGISSEHEHHFIIPIVWGDDLMGVLILYMTHWHIKKDLKTNFLSAIATSLAGILRRKHAEEILKTNTKKLEIFNQEALKAHELAESQNKKILDSIRYAQRIQNAMLMKKETVQAHFDEMFIFYKPRDIVSGDFYWFGQKGSQKIIIAADCTGHGVPGAFMTIMGTLFLDEIINNYSITEPEDILSVLDVKISNVFKKQDSGDTKRARDGMDLAVIVLDTNTNMLHFAGAKNPLYYVRDNEIHEVKGTRLSIGGEIKVEEKVFEVFEMQTKPNDKFYISSDGYQDQFGGDKKRKYMKGRFRKLIHSIHHLTMKEQAEILDKELADWKGAERQTDDILVIGLRV